MRRHLNRVSRNESEEIGISLQARDGESHLELRIYRRSAVHKGAFVPEPQAILIPLPVLPDFCRALAQAQDRLVKEGLVAVRGPAAVITMQAGEPVTLCLGDPEATPLNTRSEPRVPVKVPVQCHLLRPADTWPSKPLPEHVTGEIRDVSAGGAQAWFVDQFPISTHLAVFMQIGEIMFRGQAEVVGVAPYPEEGRYRHNLQWLSLSATAQAALSKLTGTDH